MSEKRLFMVLKVQKTRKEREPLRTEQAEQGTWKHYASGQTAVDFPIVLVAQRGKVRRDKHALSDAGLISASSPSLSDFFLSVFKRPVQLEGQVRFSDFTLN